MIELLKSVHDALQSGIDWVRDANVFYADDFDLLPEHVTFPATGIRDGGRANNIEAQDAYERIDRVEVCAYVLNFRPETLVDDAGVLALSAAVESVLLDNTLADSLNAMLAWVEKVNRSELFVNANNEPVMRQISTIAYHRWEQ